MRVPPSLPLTSLMPFSGPPSSPEVAASAKAVKAAAAATVAARTFSETSPLWRLAGVQPSGQPSSRFSATHLPPFIQLGRASSLSLSARTPRQTSSPSLATPLRLSVHPSSSPLLPPPPPLLLLLRQWRQGTGFTPFQKTVL